MIVWVLATGKLRSVAALALEAAGLFTVNRTFFGIRPNAQILHECLESAVSCSLSCIACLNSSKRKISQ
jgi:hypothetical protein